MKYPVILPSTNRYVVDAGPEAYKSKQWRVQFHEVVNENGNGAVCVTCQRQGFKWQCGAVQAVRKYIKEGGQPAYKEVGQNPEEPIGELGVRAMKKLVAHISEGRTVISQYWRELYGADDFDATEKRAQWFFEHRIR